MNSLKRRSQQGFTIVELLIVIVVIGILAALVITTYNGIQQKARNTDRTNDMTALRTKLEFYYEQNGIYPSNTDLGTNSTTNLAFIGTGMKGLDKEALRDPKGVKDDYSMNTGTTIGGFKYTYAPTKEDGTACTTAAADCMKYTLTAEPEGTGDNIVLTSLN